MPKSQELFGLQGKHELVLSAALKKIGAVCDDAQLARRLRARVSYFLGLRVCLSKCAVSRLSVAFQLFELSNALRTELEVIDGGTSSALSVSIGKRDPHRIDEVAQHASGKWQMEQARDVNDHFSNGLLFACEELAGEVFGGRLECDQSVGSLVKGIADDWKAVTASMLPKLEPNLGAKERRMALRTHPLSVLVRAAGFNLRWQAMFVLNTCARREELVIWW